MQPLAQSSANGVGGPYSATQVQAALSAPVSAPTWRYDRLNAAAQWLSDLTPYVDLAASNAVAHDTTRDVRRTLQVTFRGDATVDTLNDLIRVRYQLPMADGGLLEFSLGTFVCLPPQDSIWPGVTWRQMTAADPSQLLVDGGFLTSFSASQGMSYVDAIAEVIASLGSRTPMQVLIPDPGKVLPQTLVWEAGTTRWKAVGDLLSAINYFPGWWDDLTLRSAPIPDWNTVTPAATFDLVAQPVARMPVTRAPDVTNVYNQALVKVEDSRQNAFVGTYVNTNPASPTSVERWHAKLIVESNSQMADQGAADARARSLVQSSSRIVLPYTVDTLPWPASQDHDVYRVIWSTAMEPLTGLLYVETAWVHNCAVGQPTTHTLVALIPA